MMPGGPLPELPEVETLRRGLAERLIGCRIVRVEVSPARLRRPLSPELPSCAGKRVEAVERRAKYFLWRLENDLTVLFHLGMSGRLGIFSTNETIEKHTHAVFVFDGFQIRFRDPRRFGFIKLLKGNESESVPEFAALGPEPLSDAFDEAYLAEACRRSRRPIKNWLMDARNVAGIGNIYANEALFAANLHPLRPTNRLNESERRLLLMAVKRVLSEAVERGGTTIADFRNAYGEPGFFQMNLAVYGRRGEKCRVCGQSIEVIRLGGRSSFYCPRCQPAPEGRDVAEGDR